MDFKPISKRDAALLRRYYADCDYGLCEYSVGTRLMWRKALDSLNNMQDGTMNLSRRKQMN